MADVAVRQEPGYYIPTLEASLPGVTSSCPMPRVTMLYQHFRHIPKRLAGLQLSFLELDVHSLLI